jgi:hypothetical protein
MRKVGGVLLVGGLLLSLTNKPQAATTPTLPRVQALVATILGPKATVSDGHFVTADFDGDKQDDIAIAVEVDQAWPDIRSHGIQLADVDPASKKNGSSLEFDKNWQHCLGLLIVRDFEHAAQGRPTSSKPPVLSYACYSTLKVMAKAERARKKLGGAALLLGDGVVMEMESGAVNLVYWDGKVFRGVQLGAGD